MRKFNLEEAKAGKPVCTREGNEARIICFDMKDETFPIVALITDGGGCEYVESYKPDGMAYQTEPSEGDLFMAPEKHEGWGWVSHNNCVSMFASIFETKEEALLHKPDREEPYLAKVEWEE